MTSGKPRSLVKPSRRKNLQDKIEEEMAAIKDLVTEYSVEPLTVPFLNEDDKYERNLVIIKREKVLYQFG